MGALIHAQGITPELTAEELIVDALGSRLWIRDVNLVHGVDRSRTNTTDPASGHLTGVGLASTPSPSTYRYASEQSYDANGNVIHMWEHENQPVADTIAWHFREEWSYYAADSKLTYFNRSIGWMLEPSQKNGTFDEYRYDALGRRVLTRSRRVDNCSGACDECIEYTIFDGDQVLMEIRSETKPINPGGNGDLFGTVIYAHAGGIDRPVHVLKQTPVWYGGAGGWGSVTPHADWRGEYAIGTYANGDPCVSIGPACPEWTGNKVSSFGEPEEAGPPTGHTVWVGNLLRGRRDPSGMTYLRNRYYDATTGRFTQQDPIGLAGGLNLYGFASGDPINFSDPFGLCAEGTGDDSTKVKVTATFCSEEGKLKLYDSTGTLVYETAAGNRTVNPGGNPFTVGSEGPAPTGTWPVGAPVSTGTSISYGPFFFPVGARGDIARDRGIGIHAGRSGPQSRTQGCIRVSDAAIRVMAGRFNITSITIGCP